MKNRISLVSLCLLLTATMLLTGCGKKGQYDKAMAMYENGQYEEAAEKFTELGDYENSNDMAKACRYETAKALLDAGDYDGARKAFEELGDYENSTDYMKECDYNKANALFDAGDYEGAIAIFETIADYNDSAEKIKLAGKELMYSKYGDVLTALEGNEWYYNGGADNILNRISFKDGEAEIAQVYFDGNGKHDNGSGVYPYIVDDKNIIITMTDGSETVIAYALADGSVSLGNNDYYTLEEIDEKIQGYWRVRKSEVILGIYTENEKNIHFDNGHVESEQASLANNSTNGEYYYYGPYEGSYTLNFGGLDTDMMHGNWWFFGVVDGEVVVMSYDNICTPADGLPGEDGYSF